MTASDAAVTAVGENALRHLVEAQQHLQAGRYPSAIASAILSAEETGKLTLLATGHEATKKHLANGAFAVFLISIFEGHNARAEWIKLRDNGVRLESLPPHYLRAMRAEPEYDAFIRQVENGEFKDPEAHGAAWVRATTRKMTRELSDGLAGRTKVSECTKTLYAKGLQRLRLRATYVDVGPSGDDWNDPKSIPEDVAKGLCLGAAVMLWQVCHTVTMSRTRTASVLANVTASVSTDINQVEMSEMSTLFEAVINAAVT